MFGSYLIGLRAGLAAGLVVCVLVAHLVRAGRRDALAPVWTGAGGAAALFLGFGCALTFGSRELTFEAREVLGGSLSVLTAALVTWLALRARHTARTSTAAPAAAAFLAVGREGLETSLLVWAAVRTADDGTYTPLLAVVLGLFTAAALGLLCCRGLLRVGGAAFLTWAGALLLVPAAGFLAHGVRAFQVARLLGGLEDKAFDVGAAIPQDSWYGALLEGVFVLPPQPTVLQAAVWSLYLVAALAVFLTAPPRRGPAGSR
ncbi:FTR1 family iron permease [Streptomyces sp. NRRL B-1347]|uniref:FTR1 family iron permease n=1 Tax=Streptomyces sp. NRRL B-1347 TaxID=1476877 RepID=UPI000AAD6010|nr:FTR1 family protein [Streptomyces sp. NRRL B-1347]